MEISRTRNIRDPETYQIIGAAMVVHRELGHGFLEDVYHEAMMIEFEIQGIPYSSEASYSILAQSLCNTKGCQIPIKNLRNLRNL